MFFVTKIRNAVKIANEEIGFQTIPKMSFTLSINFKARIERDIVFFGFFTNEISDSKSFGWKIILLDNEFNIGNPDFNEMQK